MTKKKAEESQVNILLEKEESPKTELLIPFFGLVYILEALRAKCTLTPPFFFLSLYFFFFAPPPPPAAVGAAPAAAGAFPAAP